MCLGPEIAAAMEAIAAAAPEAAAAGEAAGTAGAAAGSAGAAGGMDMLGSLGGLDEFQGLLGQGGMGVAQNGIGSGGFLSQLGGAMNNPSSLLSSNGLLANAGKSAMGNLSGGKAGSGLAMQLGMNMMQPQQPQMPQGGRPAPQGPQGPLPNPYSQQPNDALSGNMPPPGMSFEEWMRRKQMMGGQGV